MTLEDTLQSIDKTLKAILAAAQSGAQMTAVAGAPASSPAAAPAPVATKPVVAPPPAVTAVSFKEVLDTILAINANPDKAAGRAGVMKVMQHFGLAEGKKVPDLETLGRNAEIKAFAESVLKEITNANDLGI